VVGKILLQPVCTTPNGRHDWELFTNKDGEPVMFAHAQAFNKHAYWRGEKVRKKNES
jgi:hypothetical protein